MNSPNVYYKKCVNNVRRMLVCKWIYEISYIWNAEKDMIGHRNYRHNLSSCEIKVWVHAEVIGSNPVKAWIFFFQALISQLRWPIMSSYISLSAFQSSYIEGSSKFQINLNKLIVTNMYRISSRQQRPSCGWAYGLNVITFENDSLSSQFVDIWSFYFRTVKTNITPSEVIN